MPLAAEVPARPYEKRNPKWRDSKGEALAWLPLKIIHYQPRNPHLKVRMPHTSPRLMAYGRRSESFSRAADEIRFGQSVRKNEKRQILNLSFCHQSPVLRRERDSNPRNLAVQRFSRPPQSTTLPSLRDKSSFFFGFRQIFLSTSAAQGIIPQGPGASLIPTSGPTACPEAG